MGLRKPCDLCEKHRKLFMAPAGSMWIEQDNDGDSILMAEQTTGRTVPMEILVFYCPACGRDLRRPVKECGGNETSA